MSTRTKIKMRMRQWGITGTIVCHGRRDWQVIDAAGPNPNGLLGQLRTDFPFPTWIINLRRKGS